MTFFTIQFCISLVTIFLRGVQTHNVIHGSYKEAAFTSVLMSVTGVAFIGLTAHDPVASLVPVALGSMIGVVLSMKYKRRGK